MLRAQGAVPRRGAQFGDRQRVGEQGTERVIEIGKISGDGGIVCTEQLENSDRHIRLLEARIDRKEHSSPDIQLSKGGCGIDV